MLHYYDNLHLIFFYMNDKEMWWTGWVQGMLQKMMPVTSVIEPVMLDDQTNEHRNEQI